MTLLLSLLVPAITTVVQAVLPRSPAWLAPALAKILPDVIGIVDDLSDAAVPGEVKFETAVTEVGAILDTAFDDVPRWAALGTERQERIIHGLVELAVFIAEPGDRESRKERRRLRKALRGV